MASVFDSTRRAIDGERYTFAPQLVAGPSSLPATADGVYSGTLLFSLPEESAPAGQLSGDRERRE